MQASKSKNNLNLNYTFFHNIVEITEPVGAKAPTFPSDSKISMFVRKEHDSFALLCQAQGLPTPLIRLVLLVRWSMCGSNSIHFPTIQKHQQFETFSVIVK